MENNHVFARERIDKWRAIRIIGMIQGKITGSMLVFLSKIWYVPAIDSNLCDESPSIAMNYRNVSKAIGSTIPKSTIYINGWKKSSRYEWYLNYHRFIGSTIPVIWINFTNCIIHQHHQKYCFTTLKITIFYGINHQDMNG